MKSRIAFLTVLCVLPIVVMGWQIGVEIEPPEACLAGAAWRVVGTEEWHGSGEAITSDEEECTIEYKAIDGWRQPAAWHVKRPLNDDTYLNVSYSKTRNRYTLLDYPLGVSFGGMERVLHLVSEAGASEGYAPQEDVSLERVYEEDAWLACDGHALQWDSRPFASEMVWRLSVQRELVAARWDATLLPEGCEAFLEGMGRRIDMSERAETALLRGEYTVTLMMLGVTEMQYDLEPGWNLLPCNLALEKAYHLLLRDRHAFAYDAEKRSYVQWSEKRRENGFWLFAREASTLTLQGWPTPPVASISQGWCLYTVEAECILPAEWPAWEFASGKYRATWQLLPGKVYWLWMR